MVEKFKQNPNRTEEIPPQTQIKVNKKIDEIIKQWEIERVKQEV